MEPDADYWGVPGSAAPCLGGIVFDISDDAKKKIHNTLVATFDIMAIIKSFK